MKSSKIQMTAENIWEIKRAMLEKSCATLVKFKTLDVVFCSTLQ